MSLRLTFQKTRAKKRKGGSAGTYYIEGTDHRGKRVHKSLKTSDRNIAKREFADRVSQTTLARLEGPQAVANFADAVVRYGEKLGGVENSNAPYIEAMMPLLGTMRLADITQFELNSTARKLYPNRGSSSLVRHFWTPFCAVWKAASQGDDAICQKRDWVVPKIPKRPPPKPPSDKEIAHLTGAGLETSRGKRNCVKGSRNQLRDECAIMFLTLTGARSGEAQRVLVADVQLETGKVTLTRDKRSKARTVTMPPMLAELVRRLIAERRAQGAKDTDLLFRFQTRYGMPQMIARARVRAGLPGHYRPHLLGRHAFASRLLAQGATPLDVQRGGGWDTAAMVDQYYGHLSEEHVNKVVAGVSTEGLEKTKKDGTDGDG